MRQCGRSVCPRDLLSRVLDLEKARRRSPSRRLASKHEEKSKMNASRASILLV